MKRNRIGILILLLGLFVLVVASSDVPETAVYAIEVAALPDGNLVVNPWFRSDANNSRPGLDSWVDEAGENGRWSVSQKDSNPAPDPIASGVCRGAEYCGTSARYANGSGQGGGTGSSVVAAYLYQVVDAPQPHDDLAFFTHWVTGWIDWFQIEIYGSDDGENWSLVWVPLSVTQANGSNHAWTDTGLLTYTPEQTYAQYQIRFGCDYVGSQGCKLTGVFFGVSSSLPTATPLPSPTPSLTPTATVTPSNTPEPTATAVPVDLVLEPGSYQLVCPGQLDVYGSVVVCGGG